MGESCKDNIYIFGGNGLNEFRLSGNLNDLWKFDGINWTWVFGDEEQGRRGDYGIRGNTAGSNKPGSRFGGVSWTDSQDNLWLFGGLGSGTVQSTLLNDLWKFDGANWTWVSGDTRAQYGIYGSKGVPDSRNKPGARNESISWIDSKGNLWLFGGRNINDWFNDLWKFEP